MCAINQHFSWLCTWPAMDTIRLFIKKAMIYKIHFYKGYWAILLGLKPTKTKELVNPRRRKRWGTPAGLKTLAWFWEQWTLCCWSLMLQLNFVRSRTCNLPVWIWSLRDEEHNNVSIFSYVFFLLKVFPFFFCLWIKIRRWCFAEWRQT